MMLVWSVNLLTGLALLALGVAMMRRPNRVWVGIRLIHNAEDEARIRGANLRTGPIVMLFGLLDIFSGPAAAAAQLSPLVLAVGGLATLMIAIVALIVSALLWTR